MKKEIGKRLKLIREAKGLNQNDLGLSLGIQYQHVSKYERGESVPTWENLIKLIDQYNVNINWLLTGKGKMFLSQLGYEETEGKSPLIIKDSDSAIDEIIEELNKDRDLKSLIHEYIKNYVETKRSASKLSAKTEGLLKKLK
jgi:transcriptional regulator with XRE-family HTH domain